MASLQERMDAVSSKMDSMVSRMDSAVSTDPSDYKYHVRSTGIKLEGYEKTLEAARARMKQFERSNPGHEGSWSVHENRAWKGGARADANTGEDGSPLNGTYVKVSGRFIKISSNNDGAIDRAIKSAGLWKKGGTYPDFDVYENGKNVGGGGGPNSGRMDAARADSAADTLREIETLDKQYDQLVREYRQAQADLKRSKSAKNMARFQELDTRVEKLGDRLRDLRDKHQKEARSEERANGNAKLKEQRGKQGSLFDSAPADTWEVTFQDPEGYSQPGSFKVHAASRDEAVRMAREEMVRKFGTSDTLKRRTKNFTLKDVVRKDGSARKDSAPPPTRDRIAETLERCDKTMKRLDAMGSGARADASDGYRIYTVTFEVSWSRAQIRKYDAVTTSDGMAKYLAEKAIKQDKPSEGTYKITSVKAGRVVSENTAKTYGGRAGSSGIFPA